MKSLSHSSISLYLECPLKYKFRYLDKIPEEPRHYFAFGKSMHSAVEYFYDVRMPPPPGLEQVLESYRKGWISEGYKDKDQEDQYFREGERILRKFVATHIGNFRPPLFTEYRFKIDVDGVPVMGFVDRIDKLENGKIAILDYKTGKSFDLDRVKSDPQLTLYQMACRQSIGLEVENVTLYHLPSNTAFTTGMHPAAQEARIRERVRKVADGIADGAYDPDPDDDKCRWCDYKKPNPAIGFSGCPAWRDEYMTPEEKQGTSYGKVDIESRVDAYGDLKSKMKSLESDLESLRKEIEMYFRDKKLRKVDGKKYQLFCEFKDKWNFSENEEALHAFLKESGLWERILSPSYFWIQKLLKDRELDGKTREQLESLGKKESASTVRCFPLMKDDSEN